MNPLYGKLSQAAKSYNVHYRTILNWAKSGRIQTRTLPSGSTHYQLLNNPREVLHTIVYARVSSSNQKEHLKSQTEILLTQYPNAEVITEVASGLNFKRKKLWSIVQRIFEGERIRLVVTYKDRLTRFGFDLFEQIFRYFESEIVVLKQISTSPEDELVQDLLSIIHVFSSRVYGLRKYKQEIKGYIRELPPLQSMSDDSN